MLLNVEGVGAALNEVHLEEVTRFIAPEEALNQNRWAVTLEAAFESIDVHFKVEFVLFGARLITVVRNVPLHVLVQSSETVTKRGVLNSLLICDHVVVQCFEAWD